MNNEIERLQEEQNIMNGTCPNCGNYSLFNGDGIQTRNVAKGLFRPQYKDFELYTCTKCGYEWEIEED